MAACDRIGISEQQAVPGGTFEAEVKIVTAASAVPKNHYKRNAPHGSLEIISARGQVGCDWGLSPDMLLCRTPLHHREVSR
jgi:hypothetical protein